MDNTATILQVEDPTAKFISHLKNTNQSFTELIKLRECKDSFLGVIEVQDYREGLLTKPMLIGNRMQYVSC